MSHFAQLNEAGIVTRVLTCADDTGAARGFLATLGGTWVQTSFNTRGGVHVLGGTPLRKNYAGVGFSYDAARDAFIAPKPAAIGGREWTLDEATCLWVAP